jgi:hypothetical protein
MVVIFGGDLNSFDAELLVELFWMIIGSGVDNSGDDLVVGVGVA